MMIIDIADLKKKLLEDRHVCLRVNDRFGVVSASWFEKLLAFVGLTTDYTSTEPKITCHPREIVNKDICDEKKELKRNLIDCKDFYVISKELYENLKKMFGFFGPEIIRTVVEVGKGKKDLVIEVYRPRIKVNVVFYPNNKERTTIERNMELSRVETIREICKSLMHYVEKKIEDKRVVDIRLLRIKGQDAEIIDIDEDTLYDNGIGDGSELILEVFTEPNIINTSRYDGPLSDQKRYVSAITRSSHLENIPGLCGLCNLGNTCFMNSAIQCLSNVPYLTDYFRKDKYLQDLNEENPLGMKGRIARAYAELIKNLWSSSGTVYSPSCFKSEISRFAHQFSGFSQQDAQELMSFLLDGLHEDLNRIRKKPYINQTVDERLSDESLAEQAWNNYKKRNDSIVVDIFHGLIKSTLHCLRCSTTSRIFDPFCFLSLPMPFERFFKVYFVNETNEMKALNVSIPFAANARTLLETCINEVNVPVSQVSFLECSNREFHKVISYWKVSQNKTYFICHLPSATVDDVYCIVLFEDMSPDMLCFPAIIKVPKTGVNHSELHNLVYAAFQSIVLSLYDIDFHFVLNFDLLSLNEPIFEQTDITKKFEHNAYIQARIYYSHTNMPFYCFSNCNIIHRRDGNQEVSLYDCLNAFTSVEKLSDQDYWYCPKCKDYEPATKKLDIWSLPKVLIIHLKRFYYHRISRDKIEAFIRFPLENLEIEQFVKSKDSLSSKAKYNLIAVTNHFGGLDGGHYTAYAKNRVTKEWYVFDDKSIKPVRESEICSSYAYILFYMKEDECVNDKKVG